MLIGILIIIIIFVAVGLWVVFSKDKNDGK